MTTEQSTTLVFKDEAGDYLLVPRETLERGRVPDEHTADVERLIAEAMAPAEGEADVQGFQKMPWWKRWAIENADPKVTPLVPVIQFPPSSEPIRSGASGGAPA